MASMIVGGSKLPKLDMCKKLLSLLANLIVFLAIVYELPASVIIGVWSSFGVIDSTGFINYRLKFAAIAIAVCSVNLMINYRGISRVREYQIYLFMITYMLVVVFLNRDEYAFLAYNDTQSASALEYWIPIFFKYALFFFVGLQIVYLRAFRYLMLLALVLAGVVVLQYVDYEFLGIDRRNFVAGANVGIYLFLGDAFSITALLTIALFKRNTLRLLIFIFSAVVIFLIGSRTSFIVFSFVVTLYFMMQFRAKLLPYYLAICLAVFALASTLDFTELADRNARMIGVFTDYEDDNSVNIRRRFAELGWEDIKNNPILGRFGGQRDSDLIATKEGWRSYMHSLFSYWRQFGIVVFGLICYIYFRFGLGVLYLFPLRQTAEFRIYFLLGSFIIIESLFSRSFAFAATHVIFGLAVSMYLKAPKLVGGDLASDRLPALDIEKPLDVRKRRRKRRRSKSRLSF